MQAVQHSGFRVHQTRLEGLPESMMDRSSGEVGDFTLQWTSGGSHTPSALEIESNIYCKVQSSRCAIDIWLNWGWIGSDTVTVEVMHHIYR